MKQINNYFCLIICLLTLGCTPETEMEKLAQTPPMGWNSWNSFRKPNINEKVSKECIDAIVNSGLRDAGYNYFVIDGGWRAKTLNEKGELQAHPGKFPNGIKPIADYAHKNGLKFGLHTVPGTHDCGGDKVGAYGKEELHIQQFIDWGVDFIKLDKCKLYTDDSCKILAPRHGCWNEENLETAYRKWRTILDEKESNILLSICAYRFREWNPEVGNMSRTTPDIANRLTNGGRAIFGEEERGDIKNVFSVLRIADTTNQYAEYAKPGYWNDPDVMVTGDHGLNYDEQCSHFALWCIMTSPLFLGNDPRFITEEEKSIILNKEAIAINQDNTEQGRKIDNRNNIDIWKKNLMDGSTAILLVNRSLDQTTNFILNFEDVGIETVNSVYDIFDDTEMKNVKNGIEYTLSPHACRFLKINAVKI